MKKMQLILSTILIVLAFNVTFARQLIIDGIITEYNGRPVKLMLNDVEFVPTEGLMDPIVLENRVLVPVREVFEKLGGEVVWKDEDQSVTITFETKEEDKIVDREIILQIGSETARVDGKKKFLDVPARIINDKTMVPIRFVSEEALFDVHWDSDRRIVYINNRLRVIPNGEAIVDAFGNNEEVTEELCYEITGCNCLIRVLYDRPLMSGGGLVKDKDGNIVGEGVVSYDYGETDTVKNDIYTIYLDMKMELNQEYTVFLMDVKDKEGNEIEDYAYVFKTPSFVVTADKPNNSKLSADDKINFKLYGEDPEDGIIGYDVIYAGEHLSYKDENRTHYMYEYFMNDRVGSVEVKEIIEFAKKANIDLRGEEITIRTFYEHCGHPDWYTDYKEYKYTIEG